MTESASDSRLSNIYSSLNSGGPSGGVNLTGWSDENELVGAGSGWSKPVRSNRAGTGSRGAFTSSEANSSSAGFNAKAYGDPTASSRASSAVGSATSSLATGNSAKTYGTARDGKWPKIAAYVSL